MSVRTRTPEAEAAIRYAERGLAIVPQLGVLAATPKDARRPCVLWRHRPAPPAPSEVDSWWRRWPEASVALLTGTISGVVVFDVDAKRGGLETWHDLDAAGLTLGEGPLSQTGGGGLHAFASIGRPCPSSRGDAFAGIEIKGDVGMVTLPPSRHPKTGARYRWLRGLEHPVPPLPAWAMWAIERARPTAPPVALGALPDAGADDVLHAVAKRGWYLGRHRTRRGAHRVRCPWAEGHSDGQREAALFEPGATAAPGWAYRCLHASCAGRSIGALLDSLGIPRRRGAA